MSVKRIDKERILNVFSINGVSGVIDLFNSSDALILLDEISLTLYDVLVNCENINESYIFEYINKIKSE